VVCALSRQALANADGGTNKDERQQAPYTVDDRRERTAQPFGKGTGWRRVRGTNPNKQRKNKQKGQAEVCAGDAPLEVAILALALWNESSAPAPIDNSVASEEKRKRERSDC
jgi:hypothetical protein